MSLILNSLAWAVALIALVLASQAIYQLVLWFQRWTINQRVAIVTVSALIGTVSFCLLWMVSPYAELWTIELWASVLTVYIASCIAIWLNRKSDKLPISTWTERAVVFVISHVFYFASAALSAWTSGGIINSTSADFAVLVPFVFGCLSAYLLSRRGLKRWAHTVLVVQSCWCAAYLFQFALIVKSGGFFSIPFLTLMFLFFPAVTILVLLGAWLGYRSAQLRLIPTQTAWPKYLLELLRPTPIVPTT
jgi:hypothetical protein